MRPIIDAWSRSIHCCARWLILQVHWPIQQSSADIHGNALMYKLVQVLSKTPGTPLEQPLINVLSRSSVDHMSDVVFFIQLYLMDHFHVGPYRRDRDDAVVAAVKALAFLYECNAQRVDRAEDEVFIHEELLGKLVIKDEYRVWKRVLAYGEGRPSALTLARVQQRRSHSDNGNMVVEDVLQDQQRRSRLFMTTNLTSILLPYPFVNSYQFSWLSYPFLLSAAVKRKVLLMDCMGSMSREYEHACVNHTLLAQAQRLLAGTQLAHMDHTHMKSAICPYLLLEIRRLHFVQDTWHQVSQKWADLKKPLKIKFVDGGEEGVDQGGVQKEFFAVLFEHLLAKQTGLFGLLTDDGEPSRLYWFRATPDPDIHGYEMLGVLLGLAIYNGVLLQLAFPRVLWQLLLQPDIRSLDELPLSMDDLRQAWPQLAQGLDALLAYDGDDVENVFCRNYERTIACFEHENDATSTMTVPLIEGGQWIAVTNANRQQYVADYARHVMLAQHRDAILALRRGLWCVLGCSALTLLTPSELERIACGWALGQHSVDLDMAELEAITEYDDGYHADHPVIRDFWSIVHVDMTAEQKHKLLLFVTASDRIPVGGLKELTFVIQRNGPDSDRLPTALTCFARLLLPEYASRDKLRDRLITSIENSKGFGLV
ncbi:hypothetical protein BC940DRAFT_99291 [Gongronella butleri]|nr:hypothetical protein BC940DRAFT_99291 [Gongronella butleri]